MTIRVSVKNEDSRDTAVIGVKHGDRPEKELKGGPAGTGEKTEVMISAGDDIHVRELRQ